jgi:hypothetical protein
LTRVPVILHGRTSDWYRQLRLRLREQSVRWFESRSAEDLRSLLSELAAPVVVIDLGREPVRALRDLILFGCTVPGARILILDPLRVAGFPVITRELGATHVISGFVPPPEVADLLARWIVLARRDMERAGWSRSTFSETGTDPWSWLLDYVDEPGGRSAPASGWGSGRRLAGTSAPPE